MASSSASRRTASGVSCADVDARSSAADDAVSAADDDCSADDDAAIGSPSTSTALVIPNPVSLSAFLCNAVADLLSLSDAKRKQHQESNTQSRRQAFIRVR